MVIQNLKINIKISKEQRIHKYGIINKVYFSSRNAFKNFDKIDENLIRTTRMVLKMK